MVLVDVNNLKSLLKRNIMKNLNIVIIILVASIFGMTSCQKDNLDNEFKMISAQQDLNLQENSATTPDVFDGENIDLPMDVTTYNMQSAYVQKLNKQFQQTEIAQSRNGFVDNGEDIVFCGGTVIAVQHADGAGTRILFDAKSFDSSYNTVTSPVWSNDGTKIAFAAMNRGTKADIIIINADGSNPVLVHSSNYGGAFADGEIRDLSWSSNNRFFAFKLHLVNSFTSIYNNGTFQYVIDFETGEERWVANGNNMLGMQFEPFLNGTQFAYRQFGLLSEKLYIKDINTQNIQTWWDFKNDYPSLSIPLINELAWNSPTSIYAIIEATGGGHTFQAHRVDKVGNSFQSVPVFNAGQTPIAAITVSPYKQRLYTTLKTNEGNILYLIQLDSNGRFVEATRVGYGTDVNWRLVKPTTNGRSNVRVATEESAGFARDLIKTAMQMDIQASDQYNNNLPSAASVVIFAGAATE